MSDRILAGWLAHWLLPSALHSLSEFGPFEFFPCGVPDVEHPHCFPPFSYFIDDSIDMRLIAVKQVTQLPPCLPGQQGSVREMMRAQIRPLPTRCTSGAACDSAAFFSL